MTTPISQSAKGTQRGAALVVSLLLLTIMTIAGVSGMQSTAMEERMTGSMRDHSLAFEAAESALTAAEARLNPVLIPNDADLPQFSANGANGYYSPPPPDDTTALQAATDRRTQYLKDSWWKENAANTVKYAGGKLAKILSDNYPMYVIEQLRIMRRLPREQSGHSFEAGTVDPPLQRPRVWYQITAHGTGGSETSVAITQSIYLR